MSEYGSKFSGCFTGSYYELAMELSLAPSDARLAAALDALWTAPRIQGPWSDKSYAHMAAIIPPDPDNGRPYYGVITVDEWGDLPFVSWIIREADSAADWLSVSVPTQALVERGLDRLLYDAPEFTRPLDRAFVDVGERIFSRAGFELGIIGEETSGKYSSNSFSETDLPLLGFLLPEPLWSRVHAADIAALVAPGLKWIPPGPP